MCSRSSRLQFVGLGLLGPLLVFATCVSLATSAAARPGAVPDALSAIAAARGTVRVIVSLDVAFEPEGTLPTRAGVAAQRGRIRSAQGRIASVLAGVSHRIHRNFESIPYAALEVSPAALAALAASDLVVSVQEDVAEPPLLSQSTSITQATAAWTAGSDGSGQVVAVLDTGAESSHPMLAGKVVAEACFSGGRDCPNGGTSQVGTGAAVPCDYDAQGGCFHGTHVSGIAVGNGPSLDGVARGAALMPIQVFSKFNGPGNCGIGNSPCALSYIADQIAALEYVLSLHASYSIAAVNMSLGGAQYTSTCDSSESARKAAIDNLRSVGIATVVASGNDSNSNGISTPACISTAVSVGSTNKSNVVSSFSNSDSFLSLLAPGEPITSALPDGLYGVASGTSMATPHVAGAWAILRQYSPTASVSEILSALQSSGFSVTDSRNGVETSSIRIQSAKALLACADADADGVCDVDDLCPGFDDTVDSDADGTPDGCDADDDADGLLDGVESGTGVFVSANDTGSDPELFDTDGDGFGDGDEVAAGSDPNLFASQPLPPEVPAVAASGRLLLALFVLLFGVVAGSGRRGSLG